ncbi:MAG: hypothetical protein KBD63_04515 [Bacteriovoracaceae bacterium]|nr:hypothetical protein [Bacteriovoracaceae bacterium]
MRFCLYFLFCIYSLVGHADFSKCFDANVYGSNEPSYEKLKEKVLQEMEKVDPLKIAARSAQLQQNAISPTDSALQSVFNKMASQQAKMVVALKFTISELASLQVSYEDKAEWFSFILKEVIQGVMSKFSFKEFTQANGILFSGAEKYRVYFEKTGAVYYSGSEGCKKVGETSEDCPQNIRIDMNLFF